MCEFWGCDERVSSAGVGSIPNLLGTLQNA